MAKGNTMDNNDIGVVEHILGDIMKDMTIPPEVFNQTPDKEFARSIELQHEYFKKKYSSDYTFTKELVVTDSGDILTGIE